MSLLSNKQKPHCPTLGTMVPADPSRDLVSNSQTFASRSTSTAQPKSDDLTYWRKQLANVPPALELLTDRARGKGSEFHKANVAVQVPRQTADALKNLSAVGDGTFFTMVLAALAVLLSRLAAQDDVVLEIVAPEGGHNGTGVRSTHLTALRTYLGDDPSFNEVLRRVSNQLRADAEHRTMPLAQLFHELYPGRTFRNAPLSRVLFSQVKSDLSNGSDWHPTNWDEDAAPAMPDLHVQVNVEHEGVVVLFTYNAQLFDHATVERWSSCFTTLLDGILADPSQPISRLPLLNTAERRQLLFDWNNTTRSYPQDRCVHELFEDQARRTPDAVAVTFEKDQLTYRQLNERANQLASHLSRLGVAPDMLVGICTERCADMVVGLLGILKAGGAYVPLDPQYPADRLALMLDDSRLSTLVTQNALTSKFSGFAGQLVCLDSTAIDRDATSFASPAKPDNAAYVIYTSGSTGKPKGVQIDHRALVNFLVSMKERPGLSADDTLVAVTTISFDIAGLELYLPLIVGARVVIASRNTAADPYELQSFLLANAPSVMQATPATWRLLIETGWTGSKGLKVLCGGEAMTPNLATELLERAGSVWNMYGPTETTVWSTVSEVKHETEFITIGRPIANTDIYVLDRHLEPVPVGVAGDLYIGGDGVARGYLYRPELTTERFISHPFRDRDSGARLYNTGDLARYRANGDLECLGRTDNQVKVRGFRIELGEIETAINAHADVKQNVVVAREDTPGEKRLVAYVVATQSEAPSVDSLRESLRHRLPEYMVPSLIVFLDSLPLTPNGKVDRKALPQPDYSAPEREEKSELGPRGGIEFRLAKIWQSVLGLRRVGVSESFFELGGHSLLVPKLIGGIEQAFGVRLSVATIFAAPTIAQQASLLQAGEEVRWPSAVLPIQPAGNKPALFCFGYAAGPVFLPLARRLGSDQPLLGVDPMLIEPARLPASSTMEDIAAHLASQIRELYPTGPYYLGGFCGGGLVAYATATQLAAQGHNVGMLALFEPHTSYRNLYSNGDRNFSRLSALRFHIENVKRMEPKLALGYIRHRLRVHLLFLGEVFAKLTGRFRSRKNDEQQHIGQILTTAYQGYDPQPFSGPLALFQATRREPGGEWERQYWTDLASTLDVHEVPGYSNWLPNFFLEPSATLLAKTLQTYLGSS